MQGQIDFIDEKVLFGAANLNIKHWKTRREFEKKHNLTLICLTNRKRGYRLSDINKILGAAQQIQQIKLETKWTIKAK